MTMLPRWAALIDRLKDRGQLPMGKGKSPGERQNGSDRGKGRVVLPYCPQ